MKSSVTLLARVAFATVLLGAPLFAAENIASTQLSPAPLKLVSLAALNAQTARIATIQPRMALANADDAAVREASEAGLEPGQAPNYLRALASFTGAAKPFAHLLKTAVDSGQVAPETKLIMGLRVAQLHRNVYLAAHLQRVLQSRPNGARWLATLKADKTDALPPSDRLALRYAELLTRDIHGVDEAEFQRTRAQFNDSQIVELTLTTCLWNYFSRLCAGFNLPLEAWARPGAPQSTLIAASAPFQPPLARVGLISDDELAAFTTASTPAPVTPNNPGLGIRVANSKRAMMRVPLFGTAWFDYWQAVREGAPKASATKVPTSIGREMLLQVSFAVSMANGCRYCTLHQVQGLRRLNVDPAKLLAMKKDDAVLTPRERIAVTFARKLTRDPASVSDADYAALQGEFGVSGAGEVVLQTGAFSFMNRFTDGLNLPSEDEAVQTYREVYGSDYGPIRTSETRRALRQEP